MTDLPLPPADPEAPPSHPPASQVWAEVGERMHGDRSLAQVLAAVDVKPARDSDVLSITVRWSSPEQAAALANAFAQAYLDTSVSLRADQARRFSGFFEGPFE